MNNQQAIDRLVEHLEWGWTEETVAAIEMGIHALKETQWIPCSEKMPEDNTDVKPIILDELNGDIDYECPLCGKQVMSDTESRNNYCGECGCKFDWSEIDETD